MALAFLWVMGFRSSGTNSLAGLRSSGRATSSCSKKLHWVSTGQVPCWWKAGRPVCCERNPFNCRSSKLAACGVWTTTARSWLRFNPSQQDTYHKVRIPVPLHVLVTLEFLRTAPVESPERVRDKRGESVRALKRTASERETGGREPTNEEKCHAVRRHGSRSNSHSTTHPAPSERQTG